MTEKLTREEVERTKSDLLELHKKVIVYRLSEQDSRCFLHSVADVLDTNVLLGAATLLDALSRQQAEITSLREQVVQWRTNSRENKLIAEEADRRAEAAEARVAELTRAVETVCQTFERDEAQGYRSKDRQFAISILRQALAAAQEPNHD